MLRCSNKCRAHNSVQLGCETGLSASRPKLSGGSNVWAHRMAHFASGLSATHNACCAFRAPARCSQSRLCSRLCIWLRLIPHDFNMFERLIFIQHYSHKHFANQFHKNFCTRNIPDNFFLLR